MVRYGITRSPYSDKFQARAIELMRLVESGDLKADGLLGILNKEFPRNKRLKEDQLTLKVVRTWAKKRPDLPEIMEWGRKPKTFDDLVEEENLHDIVRLAMNEVTASVINSQPYGKFLSKDDQDHSK